MNSPLEPKNKPCRRPDVVLPCGKISGHNVVDCEAATQQPSQAAIEPCAQGCRETEIGIGQPRPVFRGTGCAEESFSERPYGPGRKRPSNTCLERVFAHACLRQALSLIAARAGAICRTVQSTDIADKAKVWQIFFLRGDVPPAEVGVLAREKIVRQKGVADENIAGREAAAGGGDLRRRGTGQTEQNHGKQSGSTQDMQMLLIASRAGGPIFGRVAHRFAI